MGVDGADAAIGAEAEIDRMRRVPAGTSGAYGGDVRTGGDMLRQDVPQADVGDAVAVSQNDVGLPAVLDVGGHACQRIELAREGLRGVGIAAVGKGRQQEQTAVFAA